jgi:hypothetical protein
MKIEILMLSISGLAIDCSRRTGHWNSAEIDYIIEVFEDSDGSIGYWIVRY